MKKQRNESKNQKTNKGIKPLSDAELAMTAGGTLSPSNCNALAANGFWVSYAKYC